MSKKVSIVVLLNRGRSFEESELVVHSSKRTSNADEARSKKLAVVLLAESCGE